MSTSKSAASYRHIFKFIEQDFNLNPKQFISDFEAGLRKAIREVYPEAVLNGCWFHYRKCIRKKIIQTGVSKLWNKKERSANPQIASYAKKVYKMVSHLPLLPKELFLAGYKQVKKTATKFKLTKNFGGFFKYYDRTWIAEVWNLLNNHLIKHSF